MPTVEAPDHKTSKGHVVADDDDGTPAFHPRPELVRRLAGLLSTVPGVGGWECLKTPRRTPGEGTRPTGTGSITGIASFGDWPSLLTLAHRWCVSPPLWLRVRHDPDAKLISAAILDRLRDDYHANVRRNGELRGQLLQVLHRLHEQGRHPVVLKGGTHLLSPPGGNPGARVMGDVDLLFPSEDAAASQDLLHRWGWRITADGDVPADHHHYPKLQLPGGKLILEVHVRPFIEATSAISAAFLREAVALPVDGINCRIASRHHRLLHNAVHAFTEKDFAQASLWNSAAPETIFPFVDLRQLLDYFAFARMDGPTIDWASLVQDAASVQRRRELRQWGFLANQLMNAGIPDEAAGQCAVPPEVRNARLLLRYLSRSALLRTGLFEAVHRWGLRWPDGNGR